MLSGSRTKGRSANVEPAAKQGVSLLKIRSCMTPLIVRSVVLNFRAKMCCDAVGSAFVVDINLKHRQPKPFG